MPHLASVVVNKPSLHIDYTMTRRITKLSPCISFSPEICIANPEHAAHVGYPAGSICVAHCVREAPWQPARKPQLRRAFKMITLFVRQQKHIYLPRNFTVVLWGVSDVTWRNSLGLSIARIALLVSYWRLPDVKGCRLRDPAAVHVGICCSR